MLCFHLLSSCAKLDQGRTHGKTELRWLVLSSTNQASEKKTFLVAVRPFDRRRQDSGRIEARIAVQESPERAGRSGATVRILFRYHTGSGAIATPDDAGSPTFRETVLDQAVAEGVIRAQGGKLTVDNSDASETVIVMDLPAPE